MKALRGLLRKELYHVLRDRQTLAILLGLPILQVLLFGYAIRTEVDDVRLAVVSPVSDAQVQAVVNRFVGSGFFRLVATVPEADRLAPLFAQSAIDQALVFPADFAEQWAREGTAEVLVITDATAPNTGSTMQSYALRVLAAYEQERAGVVESHAGAGVRIVPRVRMRFNPTLRSENLFVPGLLAFVLTIVSALMTSISLAREKETGTMEVLLVSPLRPVQIILGKVLPYLALSFVNVLSVLALARFVFGVPLQGSLTLLLAESLLFVVVMLALGVLISTRASSQRAAMFTALIGLMMPTGVLSGMIFPIASMPAWLQPLTHIIPAKWYILVVRGIMLKGVGLDYLWPQTLVLAGMAVLLLAASHRSFHERLG